MAITILQEPEAYSNLHSPLWHKVSSDLIMQPDFRFVFDVYVDGGPLIRLKISPDADTYGAIDISRVVRSYLEDYYNPAAYPAGVLMKTEKIVIPYEIQYREENGGVLNSVSVTEDYEAWNAYSPDTAAANPYTAVEPKEFNWLTDRDITNIQIPRNGHCMLSFMGDLLVSGTFGVTITDIDDPLSTEGSAAIPAEHLNVLDLNLESLNTILTTPMPTNIRGYRLFVTIVGVDDTETIEVTWLCEPKIPATTIHFMNRYGAFDTYHFTGPTRKSLDIEAKTYGIIEGAQTPGFTVYPTVKSQFNTRQTWTRRLTSGYVDQATHEWLWQLVASPQVFIELDGYHYPVIMKTARWTEKLSGFDKMFNLELDIEMARNLFSQSR